MLKEFIVANFQNVPYKPAFMEEGTIYFVKEKDSSEQIERWLQRNFDSIFQNELNECNTLEKDMPQKKTYKQFVEWFDIEFHSMILDMEESAIINE